MIGFNGGLIGGFRNTTTGVSVPGVWTANEQVVAQRRGAWSSYLVDAYPGAAAAYSLRRLSGNAANVVRVRRSSDNTERNFSPDEVDDGSLASWVGAGNNGFVRTWYDQSGNGVHAEMATTSLQPRIVNGGVLETQAGKPQVYFTGGAVRLETGTALTGKSRIDLYAVKYTIDTAFIWLNGSTAGGANYGPVITQSSSDTTLYQFYGTPTLYANNNLFSGTTRGQLYTHFNGYKLEVHENATTSVWNCFDIGNYGRDVTSLSFVGGLQEFVIYTSNQSANRIAIQANINTYYAIY